MKKYLILIWALCNVIVVHAQSIVVGDMDGDSHLTIGDVTQLVNTILGKTEVKTISLTDPNIKDLQSLEGVWTNIEDAKMVFRMDGSASYSNLGVVELYEYYPHARMLEFLDSNDNIVGIYDVLYQKGNVLVICLRGTNDYVCFYKDVPFESFDSYMSQFGTIINVPNKDENGNYVFDACSFGDSKSVKVTVFFKGLSRNAMYLYDEGTLCSDALSSWGKVCIDGSIMSVGECTPIATKCSEGAYQTILSSSQLAEIRKLGKWMITAGESSDIISVAISDYTPSFEDDVADPWIDTLGKKRNYFK